MKLKNALGWLIKSMSLKSKNKAPARGILSPIVTDGWCFWAEPLGWMATWRVEYDAYSHVGNSTPNPAIYGEAFLPPKVFQCLIH